MSAGIQIINSSYEFLPTPLLALNLFYDSNNHALCDLEKLFPSQEKAIIYAVRYFSGQKPSILGELPNICGAKLNFKEGSSRRVSLS